MKSSGLKNSLLLSAVLAGTTLVSTSCEKWIYENEGDCTPVHKVRFVYDKNLKWADAFPSEVHSVNLYVFDDEGRYVTAYFGRGEEVDEPGYEMTLDVPAGKEYTLVAWCGLYNEGAEAESFSVTDCVTGETTLDDFICRMNTLSTPPASRADGDGDATEYSDTRLYFLYHGMLQNLLLEDNQDGREYVHTMYLTKDTNHIRIILQELTSEEDMQADDYLFNIEDANGEMAYNNLLVGDTKICYYPWAQQSDVVGVGRIDTNEGITYKKGVIADLSVGRLMATQSDKLFLVIRNAQTEEIIARVPFIQYALLGKGYYELAYNHQMSDQDFLDREDEYVMTFFLKNNRWLSDYIDILSWRIVLKDYEIDTN